MGVDIQLFLDGTIGKRERVERKFVVDSLGNREPVSKQVLNE